ncbi:TetR/AcrR family transcriptional regulator [Streptomyces sp. 8L]|uniref:TetR/AcrR family transcriptional regulator n=1 Tax=Streptomyces sp. 8L TaxID=2877242 RepID=UPI001CD7A9F7|nr:TetR/AcrR family transcriptional regulator [Streptomyces sp. 8L]MCA1223415.1 TetR/AcrR family transcriptional regulator [Streptomyces sp. 8L]
MTDSQEGGPIWARAEPATRRPRHTRRGIAEAALAVADAEGIDAVSMRRVAADLGAGTMTLYHYVRSKGDLIALMEDAIMAELLLPEGELPQDDWRAALAALAHRTRAVHLRHPWAVGGLRGAGLSPHALRHFEQSLAAVAGTGLDAASRLDLVALVDDYVYGFLLKSDTEPGVEAVGPEEAAAVESYLEAQLSGGAYPHTRALLGGPGRRLASLGALAGRFTADERFARGLDRLLDGVEREIQRVAGRSARARTGRGARGGAR